MDKLMVKMLDKLDLVDDDYKYVEYGEEVEEEEFDMNKYSEPVLNCRRNKVIEGFQAAILSISCLTFILLLFVDLYDNEVFILSIVPILVCVILEQLKDKKVQKAYEEYEAWDLERMEIEEEEMERLELIRAEIEQEERIEQIEQLEEMERIVESHR